MILLTGGAGYIGAVAVRELLDKGFAVRVLDKFLYGSYPLDAVKNQVEIVEGDICDLDESVLDGVKGVIHLAGLSNDPTAEFNPEANHRMNTVATQTIAEACKRRGIKRFIFASSCSVYDRGLMAEDILQDETSPLEPRAAYATSKFAAEQILLKLADDTFQPTILRQGTVYGWSPRMRYDLVINTFVKSAFEDRKLTVHCGGEMWRPLVDVTDVAKCYLACLEADLGVVGGQIFNLSHKNYRILELAHWVKKALQDIVDIDIVVEYGSQRGRSYRVSTRKIETALGFRPIVSVEDSARDMALKVKAGINADFANPKYYNIRWLELLLEMQAHLRRLGNIF
ncbi:MAG TPA: SDR family oxidoreductase [Candidatus Hydrogenedentes bacterium]|nr:SDR family oxidoreductase [Candidatus Hydrogenedentota bacterium]HPC16634.1 SDR family oxidoreductase [Candidatus Hydrogenedentota bacterium]HRT22128.1 SDR family oxidoreductase [Candidatus Hydrogenedentota bacterium]HRT63485.1 SDR family oxidoreductase [Candidatus Hydrogenedentota bacterium]